MEKIGIIGCGNISRAYLTHAPRFSSQICVAGVADIRPEAAQQRAEEYRVRAMSVDELLADGEISAVVNLTIPSAHVEVGRQILEAGKHVYSEKPIATTLADAEALLAYAGEKGLQVGCAPDTFLGAGQQTARKVIERGDIGRPLAGNVTMLQAGPNRWHPNPWFFFLPGGGPMLDMGPYYITTLVNMLGPAKAVVGVTAKGFEERHANHEDIKGQPIPVEIPTHVTGVLEFHRGAVITLTTSFDVQGHSQPLMQIYGSEGSIDVPDPNTFSGDVKVFTRQREWQVEPYTHGYEENSRIIGLVDMLEAAKEGRPARCSGELATHVLEVMLAFFESAETGRRVTIKSYPAQPEALPENFLFA